METGLGRMDCTAAESSEEFGGNTTSKKDLRSHICDLFLSFLLSPPFPFLPTQCFDCHDAPSTIPNPDLSIGTKQTLHGDIVSVVYA